MIAAMIGQLLVARELINLPGIDLNLADNEGNTALHLAAQAGRQVQPDCTFTCVTFVHFVLDRAR